MKKEGKKKEKERKETREETKRLRYIETKNIGVKVFGEL